MLTSLMERASRGGAHGKLSTLIFHRVLPRPDPLFPNEVDAARFNAICSWIKSWFNVIPLDQAVRDLPRRALPARALAITFDDGYADNYEVAVPILRKHGLSATFFVATGFIDGGRMWNDTIIESLRACAYPSIDLRSLGATGLGLMTLERVSQRRMAIDSVLSAVKYLPTAERLRVVAAIAEISGSPLPDNLMMSSEQVRALRCSGMQVGAHTVSHPILAQLSDDEARSEMSGSKASIERWLDEPVTLFAYPNGRPHRDFNERTMQIASDVGFKACVTTEPGVADANTELHCIPRFTPWEHSKLRFGARLLGNLLTSPKRGVGVTTNESLP